MATSTAASPSTACAEVEKILARLTSVKHVVQLNYLDRERAALTPGTILWNELLDHPPVSRAEFKYEEVPFNHPLWILFSSGTTGLPKPIMHSHGGIMIEQLKHLAFNFDMHAGERMFFFTTTGWMMWNFLVSSLLSDVTPVLYDGNPAWPDGDLLWKMVQDSKADLFGASPTYQSILEKNGIVPKEKFDLSNLQVDHAGRFAGFARVPAVVPRQREAGLLGRAGLRRHRHLFRLRRRRGDPAAARRRDAGALPRHRRACHGR